MIRGVDSKKSGERIMSTLDNITVGDVMLKLEDTPKTGAKTLLKEALELMDKYRLGITCITSDKSELIGVVTDGDIRRLLNSLQKPIAALMNDDIVIHANQSPLTVLPSTPLIEALSLMGNHRI